jgi:hypothetical protein
MPCLQPFNFSLPSVDLDNKKPMDKLRIQYLLTQAFNARAANEEALAVAEDASAPACPRQQVS